MKFLFSLFIALVFTLSVSAQSNLEKLSWLEGGWATEKWGGTVEEYWSAPKGNSIIGMFRFVVKGEVQFTEHFMITEEQGTVVLKLKHFHGDFTGWEEKDEYVEFPLIKVEEQAAYFEGISYERVDESTLKVVLDMEENDTIETEEFIFEKIE